MCSACPDPMQDVLGFVRTPSSGPDTDTVAVAAPPTAADIDAVGQLPPCPECEEPRLPCANHPERCTDCCGCVECPRCNERFAEVCTRCSRCMDRHGCCECAVCDRSRCRARVESTCSNCDWCDSCCECSSCFACCEPCESTCSNCDECDSCCDCSTCSECGDSVTDLYCNDCDRCDDCGCVCEGEGEPTDEDGEHGRGRGGSVPFRKASAEPTFHRARTFKRNPVRRFVACELEVASIAGSGYALRRVLDGWEGSAIVHDGSLPTGGFEINTPPCSGDLFVEKIEELCGVLNDGAARVTQECGYHVHVDARDLSYTNVQTLIRLYVRIEPALFRLVPRSRRNNTYATACGAEYLRRGLAAVVASPVRRKAHMEAALYGTTDAAILAAYKGEKYNSARYHALNLHSWLYRGTIEYRLAAGTTNPRKVIHWALLWGAIVSWCRCNSDIGRLPDDGFECLLRLAPTDETRAWLRERKATFWSM